TRRNALLDEVGHAMRDHPRLSASRPSQHEQRTLSCRYRFALLGVELVEKFHGECVGRVVKRRAVRQTFLSVFLALHDEIVDDRSARGKPQFSWHRLQSVLL